MAEDATEVWYMQLFKWGVSWESTIKMGASNNCRSPG